MPHRRVRRWSVRALLLLIDPPSAAHLVCYGSSSPLWDRTSAGGDGRPACKVWRARRQGAPDGPPFRALLSARRQPGAELATNPASIQLKVAIRDLLMVTELLGKAKRERRLGDSERPAVGGAGACFRGKALARRSKPESRMRFARIERHGACA
jgi:hypothetical protein